MQTSVLFWGYFKHRSVIQVTVSTNVLFLGFCKYRPVIQVSVSTNVLFWGGLLFWSYCALEFYWLFYNCINKDNNTTGVEDDCLKLAFSWSWLSNLTWQCWVTPTHSSHYWVTPTHSSHCLVTPTHSFFKMSLSGGGWGNKHVCTPSALCGSVMLILFHILEL